MAEIFVVETRGIGKPDYTRVVSSGRERPGISLKYNQQLALFSFTPTDMVAHPYAIPWVQPVLAAGLTAHIIDMSTGVATPYTLHAGYIGTLLEVTWNLNQDCEIWVYMDTLLLSCLGVSSGGSPNNFKQLLGYTSEVLDPTGASAHTMDVVIINRGGGDMRGEASLSVLIEAVGTPPFPTEKKTQCPFCRMENTVPVAQAIIMCKWCGRTYYVRAASQIRSTH